MKSKVQIIEYSRDQKFSSNYIEKPDQNTGLPFTWFKLGLTRDLNLQKNGASQSIEYQNGQRWKLITGLVPVKGYNDIYFGDIDRQTVAIWIQPDKQYIKIALFKGHTPKYRSSREKKIINFIRAQKK